MSVSLWTCFLFFCRYLYYEHVDITADNVLPVLYAAKKYMLYPLAERCMNFLQDTISVDTVCIILNHSILYDEMDLTDKCIQYIAPRCGLLMNSPSFLNLSPAAISRILRCDILYVDSECDILVAMLRWATTRALKQDRPVTDDELRAQLSDNLHQIRFLSMKPELFARIVGDLGILTDTEKSMMYHQMLTGKRSEHLSQIGFNVFPRMQKCVRYRCLGRNAGWWTCNGPGDAISFTVNRPVSLLGVSVFGGREPAKHLVNLELWLNPDTLLKQVEHTLHSDGTESPFPIYIGDDGVDLTPSTSYTILVIMKGPIAYYGQGGDAEPVSVMDVTFTFSRSEKSGNGTNVKSGQIPELLFLPRSL